MKSSVNRNTTRFYKTILLFSVVLTLSHCKWDESDIMIERFEYLDETLVNEAYLIHGYKKKFDKEINKLVDIYVCDSILPQLKFHDTKRLYFFKKSKNTNRENFQVRPDHKRIRAKSNDILFSYWFYNINDSIVPKTKYFHAVSGKEDPPSHLFRCE